MLSSSARSKHGNNGVRTFCRIRSVYFYEREKYFSFSEGIWESFLFLLSGCLQNAEGEMASVVNDESLCVTQGRY